MLLQDLAPNPHFIKIILENGIGFASDLSGCVFLLHGQSCLPATYTMTHSKTGAVCSWGEERAGPSYPNKLHKPSVPFPVTFRDAKPHGTQHKRRTAGIYCHLLTQTLCCAGVELPPMQPEVYSDLPFHWCCQPEVVTQTQHKYQAYLWTWKKETKPAGSRKPAQLVSNVLRNTKEWL